MHVLNDGKQTLAPNHNLSFANFRLPSLTILALATSLVGCTVRRPSIEVSLDNKVNGPKVELTANDTGTDIHFKFDTLNAKFSHPGNYTIIEPITGQKWNVSVDKSNVGQPIPLRYSGSRFLCTSTREGNNSNFTVIKAGDGADMQIGLGAFRLVPEK